MLPDHIQLELVTPDRLVLRENIAEVQVPGLVGYFGILPGHTPLLAELGIGQLSYRQGSQTFYATVIGGLVEVLPDRVIVLAEAAERAEEIDVARARAALERAKKRIRVAVRHCTRLGTCRARSQARGDAPPGCRPRHVRRRALGWKLSREVGACPATSRDSAHPIVVELLRRESRLNGYVRDHSCTQRLGVTIAVAQTFPQRARRLLSRSKYRRRCRSGRSSSARERRPEKSADNSSGRSLFRLQPLRSLPALRRIENPPQSLSGEFASFKPRTPHHHARHIQFLIQQHQVRIRARS